MTWILYHEGRFGAYYPDGEFTDGEDNLEAEFVRVATDEMKENYDLELLKFKRENWLSGVRPTEFAKPFQQEKNFVLDRAHKTVGDIIDFGGLLAVTAPVKDIIQKFEPETVQFWPIDIVTKRGSQANEKSYFVMFIVQARDTFRADLSVEGSCRTLGSYSENWHINGYKKAFLTGLAFDASKRDGAHIWYEKRILTSVQLFSDELAAELRRHDFLLPPRFYECVSV